MTRTDSPLNYRAIPPSQDHRSDVHDARVSGGDAIDRFYSPRHWFSSEALIRWTYFLLGCAIVLPFSALTNGTPFFLSRLVDSSFYTTFSSSLSSAYTVTKLFCLSYCTITSKQSSPSRRIFASMIMTTLFITSLCLSTLIQGTPLAFFLFALFDAVSLGVLSSYLCSAVYARAALLGPPFLRAVLSGQGAIVVAVSIAQVVSAMISLWGLSPQPTHAMTADDKGYDAEGVAARIFFGVSTLFLGVTLAAYTWLATQTYYQSMVGAVKRQADVEDTDELTPLISGDRGSIPTEENSRIYDVLKQNWDFMFSIAYVYAVTLAVYPAVTVRVRSVNPDIPPLLFSAFHFLAFNSGDLTGRLTCMSTGSIVWSAKRILAMSLVRTLFIPLIMLCNVYRPGTTTPVSSIINSDILFMVILIAMGYTNGFVSCLALLVASSPEHNPRLAGRREDVDIVATLGGTFMVVGLASGALTSFSVDAMI